MTSNRFTLYIFCCVLLIPPTSAGLGDFISRAGSALKDTATGIAKKVKETYDVIKEKIDETKEKFNVPEDWHCGSNTVKYSELAAHVMLSFNCGEDVKEEMNEVCRIHDMCYNKKTKAKEDCDYDFCLGLVDANDKADSEDQCQMSSTAMCAAVPFGTSAYEHAGEKPMNVKEMAYDESPKIPKSRMKKLNFKGFVLIG